MCARRPPGDRGSRRRSLRRSSTPLGVAVDPRKRAQLRIELVVPRRIQRVRDVKAAPVVRELEHVRAAVHVSRRIARLADDPAEPELTGQLGIGRIGDVVLADVAVQPVGEVGGDRPSRGRGRLSARALGTASPRAARSPPRPPGRQPRSRWDGGSPHHARSAAQRSLPRRRGRGASAPRAGPSFSPRSIVCSSSRLSRFQKWMRRPYRPASTSARSNPGS